MAIEIILKIRESSFNQTRIRDFHPNDYKINTRASGLESLNVIPLELAKTEPPFTVAMSDEEIKSIIDSYRFDWFS